MKEEMIEFGGKIYYFDLRKIDDIISEEECLRPQNITDINLKEYFDGDGKLTSYEKLTKTYVKSKEIDGAKFEMIRYFIDIIMDYDDWVPDDALLGVNRVFDKMPLNVQMAFNTLIKIGILKAKEV